MKYLLRFIPYIGLFLHLFQMLLCLLPHQWIKPSAFYAPSNMDMIRMSERPLAFTLFGDSCRRDPEIVLAISALKPLSFKLIIWD